MILVYTQFEEAGLIVGTEEWEEAQEQKCRQMMGEGDGDAGREKDIGKAALAGR